MWYTSPSCRGMPAADDVARVKAVRDAIDYDAVLMVDCNQQFSVSEAMRRGRLLEEFQLACIEEPVSAQDHEGEARVAGALRKVLAEPGVRSKMALMSMVPGNRYGSDFAAYVSAERTKWRALISEAGIKAE